MLWILAAIFALNLIIYALRKRLKGICPICAAVTLTWVIILVSQYLGAFRVEPVILAVLMGATLGGATEKFGSKLGLWGKTGMVLLGIPAIYYLLSSQWTKTAALLVALLIFTYLFNNVLRKEGKHEDKFEDCCS